MKPAIDSYDKIEAYSSRVHKHVLKARDGCIKLGLPFIAITGVVRGFDPVTGKVQNYEKLTGVIPPGAATPTAMLCTLGLMRHFEKVSQRTIDELMELLAKDQEFKVERGTPQDLK